MLSRCQCRHVELFWKQLTIYTEASGRYTFRCMYILSFEMVRSPYRGLYGRTYTPRLNHPIVSVAPNICSCSIEMYLECCIKIEQFCIAQLCSKEGQLWKDNTIILVIEAKTHIEALHNLVGGLYVT
jgi:hypothetical protein